MLEQLRPGVSASKARFVLFDFDGTVSVIRSGWVDVMVPMMVEILAGLKTGALPDAAITADQNTPSAGPRRTNNLPGNPLGPTNRLRNLQAPAPTAQKA